MALSRYEQLDQLGSSHIGEVWKCIDTNTGDEVAGLRLSEQIGATAGWDYVWTEVLRHFREFKHEFVVPARDTDREQRLVIMELMRGSMRMVMDKQKTTLPGLVRTCLRRSLEAMVALHGAGLLHGDVRPEQLLFRNDGGIRLSFSIGLKPGGVVLLRRNYNQYLAPELVNPGAGLVGPQVDLYALGITAYELLVGSEKLAELVPGVGANSPEPQKQWLKWQSDLKSTLPPLKEIFKKVPEDLCKVIDGLVQKNTAYRIPNAAAALALLETTGRNSDDVLVPLAEIGLDPGPDYSGPSVKVVGGKGFEHLQGQPVSSGVGGPSEPIAEPRFENTSDAGGYSTSPVHGADNSNSQGGGTGGYPPPYQVVQPVAPINSHPVQTNQLVTGNTAKRSVWKAPILRYGSLLALLIILLVGGYQIYSRYINPERTEYIVTVDPPVAKVIHGKDEEVNLTDGKAIVGIYPEAKPAGLTISATGYHSHVTEELGYLKPDGKDSKPKELKISLVPIVTNFVVTVEPVDAKLEVVKFPAETVNAPAATAVASGKGGDGFEDKKSKNAAKGDKKLVGGKQGMKSEGNGATGLPKQPGEPNSKVKESEAAKTAATDESKPAISGSDSDKGENVPSNVAPALYQLAPSEIPGQYAISIPYNSEVTITATADGFKKLDGIVLKGTGEETGVKLIKLAELVTAYSIVVQPEGVTGEGLPAIDVTVTEDQQKLSLVDGKTSLSVPWKQKKTLELTAKGFETLSESFEGIQSEVESRTISLKRSPTVYTVEIKTKDAKVELNGEPVSVSEGLADVNVPFNKKMELKVSRKYHKDFVKTVEWNDTLVGKLDPVSLEAEARPLVVKVLPQSAEWKVRIGTADGEIVEPEDGGRVLLPLGIEQFFIAAPGFREHKLTANEELFKEPAEIQLISSSLPAGLEPVDGTTFSPLLNLPIEAKLALPDNRGEMIFLLMEAREFPFGSKEPGKDELKQEIVGIESAYYLGRTEVTHGQFGGAGSDSEADLPMSGIQWSQADEYCRKIHPNGRLPTEIEWEAAATNYGTREFPWGNDRLGERDVLAKARLSFGGNVSDDKPVAAAFKMDSIYGRDQFLHMFGNLQEFCADEFTSDGNDASASAAEHVTRGCSFLTPWSLGSTEERATRLTWRGSKKDDLGRGELEDVGFRVLIEVLPSTNRSLKAGN